MDKTLCGSVGRYKMVPRGNWKFPRCHREKGHDGCCFYKFFDSYIGKEIEVVGTIAPHEHKWFTSPVLKRVLCEVCLSEKKKN